MCYAQQCVLFVLKSQLARRCTYLTRFCISVHSETSKQKHESSHQNEMLSEETYSATGVYTVVLRND